MFDTLSQRLNTIFRRLSGQGALTEKTVDIALRDIRLALLEADVGLDVVKNLLSSIRKRAIGREVLASIAPGQQVLHIVYEEITELLGGTTQQKLNIDTPPAVLMLVGLQGTGKTTSTAKLAKYITTSRKASVLAASLDVRRPAAMEQLEILAKRAGAAFLPPIQGQDPLAIARRACSAAELAGHEAVLLDTAGRNSIDESLMNEVAAIASAVKPAEILLVADGLSGQDAVQTARGFAKRLSLSGLILTRMDGDSRGGAALSMRAETGVPIKFIGTGEEIEALEAFNPKRMAGRLLGRGDLEGLIEKAQQASDAAPSSRRAKKGRFGLQELAEQLQMLNKMGGTKALASMLPGQAAPGMMDDQTIRAQLAAIGSMTPGERDKPSLLNASRKRRISKGSGTEIVHINRMLKMHRTMADMLRKGGAKGMSGKQLPSKLLTPDTINRLNKFRK